MIPPAILKKKTNALFVWRNLSTEMSCPGPSIVVMSFMLTVLHVGFPNPTVARAQSAAGLSPQATHLLSDLPGEVNSRGAIAG